MFLQGRTFGCTTFSPDHTVLYPLQLQNNAREEAPVPGNICKMPHTGLKPGSRELAARPKALLDPLLVLTAWTKPSLGLALLVLEKGAEHQAEENSNTVCSEMFSLLEIRRAWSESPGALHSRDHRAPVCHQLSPRAPTLLWDSEDVLRNKTAGPGATGENRSKEQEERQGCYSLLLTKQLLKLNPVK